MNAGPVKRQRAQRKAAGRFHHGDLREAALAEAFRIVDRTSAEGLSVRALAQRLAVSDPAIYRHFASREALLLEVARRGSLGMMQGLGTSCTLDDDPATALAAAGRAYLEFACAHRGWFRLCFSSALQDAGLYEGDAAADLLAAASAVETLLKEQLRRVVPPRLVDDHYRAFWGLVHGLAALVIERVFRRVESDAQAQGYARRAIALHVAAVFGTAR